MNNQSNIEKSAAIGAAIATGAKALGGKIMGTGLGQAVKTYGDSATKLNAMKGLRDTAMKTHNQSYRNIADAGIKNFTDRKRIAGKQIKHEIRKVPGHAADFAKDTAEWAKKNPLTAGSLGATALSTGAAIHNGKKAKQANQDKVAADYKDDIEKIAAQIMPHRLPGGGYAIPRGYESSANGGGLAETADEMNGYLGEWDDNQDIYERVPSNLTPFAGSGWETTYLHDEDGNMFNYDGELGTLSKMNQDQINEIYSTLDVNEADVAKGRKIGGNALSRLSRGYGPAPQIIGDKPINNMGELSDRVSESRRIQNGFPTLQEYQQHGLYDSSMAKQDRKDALKKTIGNIPKTLGWSAGGALMGASAGYDMNNTGRSAAIGAGIGAAVPLAIGTANAIRSYKNAPIRHAKQNANSIQRAVRDDDYNQEFLKQYKQASDYKDALEKVAIYNKNDRLYITDDEYQDYFPGGAMVGTEDTPRYRYDYHTQRAEVNDYLNNHDLARPTLDDMKFNHDRSKIDIGKGEMRKTLGKWSAGGAATGALIGGINGYKNGGRNSAMTGALGGAAIGLVPGLIGGTTHNSIKNEDLRLQKVGPSRYNNESQLLDDAIMKFNNKEEILEMIKNRNRRY